MYLLSRRYTLSLSGLSMTKVFIASPLFNTPQHAILDHIEGLCEQRGLKYYSARKDSEPFVPKGDEKKNPAAWDKVFDNNEEGLQESWLMIAVLDYALPEHFQIGKGFNVHHTEYGVKMSEFLPLSLPDSGTVWEMGYFRGLKKTVVGFHPTRKADDLNLMLTHGCDGLISGFHALEQFFQYPDRGSSMELPDGLVDRFTNDTLDLKAYQFAQEFNWAATERWGAQNGGIEG